MILDDKISFRMLALGMLISFFLLRPSGLKFVVTKLDQVASAKTNGVFSNRFEALSAFKA